ncbi:hypothetical protein NDU88_003265 [Pleurodeles waltl]|uniref:Uncharacterized protein n=1 Tax=Pleurodeles waltl TaxID=8319 RepID=A0AAV7MQ23_PLEWA|nr:hypothetical protein NDU88_003265 [Pleurodeles waltl]
MPPPNVYEHGVGQAHSDRNRETLSGPSMQNKGLLQLNRGNAKALEVVRGVSRPEVLEWALHRPYSTLPCESGLPQYSGLVHALVLERDQAYSLGSLAHPWDEDSAAVSPVGRECGDER